MQKIPLITIGNKVLFYAGEFVCRCGKCRYSDPQLIPKIMSQDVKDHLTEVRIAVKVPIIITRGVSCMEHHINIYKSIYGQGWKNHITWNSSHVPDKEKNINSNQSELFHGIDTKPLTDDYLTIWGHYCYFRFSGVIWYKKHLIYSKVISNSFIHVDNHPSRKGLFLRQKIYKKFL